MIRALVRLLLDRWCASNERDELIVLRLLADDMGSHGLDLVHRSEGRLKRGAIYVVLTRMENSGLVSSRPEVLFPRGNAVRRIYRITETGRARWRAERGRNS